jgi:hypothetical protein
MFPWSSAARRVRTAEETGQELARLRLLAAAETDFDGVILATEDRMAKSHLAATLSEATTPSGALELRRVWRETDATLGPGRNVLHVLTARHPPLRASLDRVNRYLTLSDSLISDASRTVVLARMDAELAAFGQLRQEVLQAAAADSATLTKELTAAVGAEAAAKPITLTAQQLREECERALKEAEQQLTHLRQAAGRGAKARAIETAASRRAREEVQALLAGRRAGRTAEQTSRIRAVARFHDPTISEGFARRVKQRMTGGLPALKSIDDAEAFFAEALGVAASARNPKLLRRYVELGAGALSAKDLERVRGYLSQLRGLLPEELAIRMNFLEGVFSKRAFEVLDAFPPPLRGQMTVEMVEGPLWVVSGRGAKRQFGDGCLLLTGPNGQSTIIGLGEFKAGFDADLLEQLFVRSDGRAVRSTVEFTAVDGTRQTRTLTRQFSFEGGTQVPVKEPPLYVYGRPQGETVETAEKFKAMIDDQMLSGREMWKVQLPMTTQINADFADVALEEAVKALTKAKPTWGL